ncbi:polysaccharide biosynthesis protein [Flavobacterium silvaticum]|uniref:Polysaccharide biosynthesis protein n=1 Tax=Flavobacterium silvaticum TaxID=1852020 RepID=A0A972FXK3_9FLAO|nr:nucleoside-diphosphate sugar epimerase/dehydratase [Flavobacterium silvaticum]NMH29495.1 polysaccharide biosynthesis protein [Flavobacterium silvaticum]
MMPGLFNGIFSEMLGKRFRNLGYLPRWIIFLIDVFIVSIANAITYTIVSNLIELQPNYHILNLPVRYATIIAVNAIFFVFYRTYSGIIRHSTFIDGVKLLVSTFSSFVVLLLLNYAWSFYFGYKLYLSTGLFISYVISFLLLFLFRIMVKYVFEKYMNIEDRKKLIGAVIYGADANAISVANALNTESPKRFHVMGFIDKFNQTSNYKRILNLPILNQTKSIHVILRAMKADALIIAEKSMTKAETIALVEECLEYNFKVYTVPLITDWEDDQQISNKVKRFEIEDLLERKPIELDMNTISNQLNDKTILITGAAGSIGSEITRQVLNFSPKRMILLDQAETPLHTLSLEIAEMKTSGIEIVNVLADIRNRDFIEKIFDQYRPDVVYHAAAYKHVPLMEENPIQAIHTNVSGTKNLADAATKFRVERFVMVSTDKAVNPSSVMGASKRIAEKYVQALHFSPQNAKRGVTKFITTRFGNVLGSNGSIVPLFTRQIEEGGPITITHPDIIRYFMTIPEACQLVLEAGAMGNGGEIFIFDMGKPVKILDLANKMIRLAGYTPGKEIEIKVIGLRPGEKLYEELLNNSSKNLPTHNEKIMIAVDIWDDFESIHTSVDELGTNSCNWTSEEIVTHMKKLVPEFKSMNSIFETLDK